MALTSVNPNQFAPTPPDESDPAVGNGVKIPQTPIPGASSADNDAMATMKGSNQIAQATQQVAQAAASKKSDSGGGIFGTIGSIIGKVIPFLACGGMVNYAEGGPFAPPDQSMNDPSQDPSQEQPAPDQIGMAVTVGVILEKYFGGDFDKLPDAAHMFQQMIAQGQDPSQVGENQPPMGSPSGMPDQGQSMPPQGMQFGGTASIATPAVPKTMQQPQYMALGGTSQPQQPVAQPNVPALPISQAPAPGFMSNDQTRPITQGQHTGTRPQQGFMSPMMAGGGPPPTDNPNAAAPLQPGQTFAGDGEVRGPGGPESDSIPARLSNGEYVMSAPAVAFHGVKAMDKINEEGKQGFFQSQAQVQANQGAPGQPMAPPGNPSQGAETMPPAASGMPPMGNGMMPPPMHQAKGGSAVQRTKGSGFMV